MDPQTSPLTLAKLSGKKRKIKVTSLAPAIFDAKLKNKILVKYENRSHQFKQMNQAACDMGSPSSTSRRKKVQEICQLTCS